METQIWSKAEQKWAYILILRGREVHCLKVTGNMLTLKRNLKSTLEALEEGRPLAEAGGKVVASLDVQRISKAEVSPENSSLTLYGDGDSPAKLNYSTGDGDADKILAAVIERSGRTFATNQEDIGAVEAVLPLAIFGGIGGLFWMGVYQSAGQLAAGEQVEARGRRKGMQQILIWIAELLGVHGAIAIGVVGLTLIIGWAVSRIVKRPQRTVWPPESA